jgi:hypothetical protein
MRTTTKRRATQLALVTVAAPVAGWALEQAARRADAGDKSSPTSRRLRQGADFVQRFGRGPLADGLRQRPVTTVTWREQPPPPTSTMGSDGRGPKGQGRVFAAATPPGTRPRNPAYLEAILGADRPFMGWPDGQPASVGNANPRRLAAGYPIQHGPTCFELEMPMTLPGPEATHRWQGRTLVDHHGQPLGNIEIIYLDKVTNQPEWALLEAAATGPTRTFVPLVSAGEEGDTIRVPFAKALVEGAPAMPADQELSEDQEGELYRHYGVPYSRADSPSGLPAGEPESTEPALAAGEAQPAEAPVSTSTPDVAAGGKPQVPAAEPTTAAEEPLPAGGGALSEAAIPASAVGPAPGRVDEPVAEAAATNDRLVATRQLRLTDPRVGAGAAAAVVLAVGIWRRETIGRQLGTAVSRLGAIPATVSRQRRRRRRAKALNQAMTGAAQQTTALARATARLVAGTALLPVTVTVRTGRRARAGIQATQQAISQAGRRVRPGRGRRRRGGTVGMAVGGAAGYVLGAKAGRQRYQQIAESARRLQQRPEVRRISEQAVAKLDQLSGQAADRLQAARQSTRTEARQQRWAADHRRAGNANGDTVLANCGAACGSGPDADRADRPARRGRSGC